MVGMICEGQRGEEAVRGFLLPRRVTSSNSEFGFHLVKYLEGSVDQPKEEDNNHSLGLPWGSQHLGMYGPKTVLVWWF
jgi:hypothetical protein